MAMNEKIKNLSPYTKTCDQILEELGVSADVGLSENQVLENRRTYGENSFTRKKSDSLIVRFLKGCAEPMVIMLIAAGLITLGVNIVKGLTGGHADFLECAGIFAAILLSVIITLVMEGRSAKAFEALNKITEDTHIRVIREGKSQLIPQHEVVVGDILCIETGNKLPADARLICSASLTADESALTGESMAVQKSSEAVLSDIKTPVAERINMLYSGCFITGGSGRAVVTGVGDNTEFGKIACELSGDNNSSTPLQEKMAKLGKCVALIGAIIAAIVFIIQLIMQISQGTASLDTVAEAFITSIILIVAAVPEGLPTIMAVSLAINVIKMSKQNALVKKMIACETAGCINVICSDKTGTLTENKMTVIGIYNQGEITEPSEITDEHLIKNICVNSTADVNFENGADFIGNPTECALLTSAHKSEFDYRHIRENTNILYSFPFSSETKNMTTITSGDSEITAYSKGSPEKILSMCLMPESLRQEINDRVISFQEKACRVIAFAHKSVNGISNFEDERESIERDMEFDGFAAITDPLRSDVFDAVNDCRTAGIELKMLTGDNLVTAKAIANDLKIIDDNHIAVEANYIDALSEKELISELPKIRVIARSTPAIKMRVVNALRKMGNVVAVTGDGINDAPAIKNADVGIAMGISGTEVSKEASDIVLLDDSFSTIVKSVKWGRGIYENFQRFIQFQLTVNLSSVLVILCSIIAGLAAPFTTLQLLWINIIMDGPPALTLGLEPIRANLMKRRPTRRNESIVSKEMLMRIGINGLFIAVVFMLQSTVNFLGGTPGQQPTILFTLFVVFQLFNAFGCRELGNSSIMKNLISNKLMLGVFGLTFALQVIITQFGGMFFGTVPLPLMMWLKIIILAFSVLIVTELTCLIRKFYL